jgi:hypothetical protein
MANLDVDRGDRSLIERFINYAGSRYAKLRAVILYDSSEAELFTAANPGQVALQASDGTDIGDVDIARKYTTATLTMADNAAITDAVNMSAYAGGTVHVPTGWVAANVGFSRATTVGGTYTRMRDQTGTLLQITGIVADQVYPLPTELFGCGFVKLLSQNASGNDVSQTGGPLSLVVELKS